MFVTVFGDRVRSARILRNLKSAEVASIMDWPASRQTRLEQSFDAQLADHQFRELAKALDFPEIYFQTKPPAAVTPESLLFRTSAATTKREKSYLAEFARAGGEVLEWLDHYHRLPPVRVPVVPAGTPTHVAAAEVRESLGVGLEQPIEHLTHLAERAGVPVVMRGVPGNLSLQTVGDFVNDIAVERHLGYSVRVGEHGDRPITVLRAVPSWERVRWTMAHELGHISMHGSVLSADSEDEANRFASELLAPAAAIAPELPSHITLASLTPIKLRWGISLGALIIHLAHNDLIDASRFDTLRRQLYTRTNPSTGRTWGRDEPGWDAREVERPRLLSTWLERCIGYSVPAAVAQMFKLLPTDVIASMLSGQRNPRAGSKSQVSRRGVDHDNAVVSLQEWRLRQVE